MIVGAYFHVWHFIYSQIQLTNWFGNVVAGVVVFIVVDVCWQWFLKRWVTDALHRVHVIQNAELHRKLDHIIQNHPDIPPLPKDKQ